MEINRDLERDSLLYPLLSEINENDLNILLVITSETLGKGDIQLGKKLMYSFLFSLTEMPPRIRNIILLNEGIKLAFRGAKTLDSLNFLQNSKITIIVCEESLHHYGNLSILEIGRPVSMYTIADMMLTAEKMIVI